MRNLSLPGRLLTNPIRNRCYIVKLNNYSDPASRQRGCKGSCISFCQRNPVAGQEKDVLPRPLSELPDYLHVCFVGHTKPTEAQLKKIFKVDADDISGSLAQWRNNGHAGFTGTWQTASNENLQGIRDCKDTGSIIAECVFRASETDDEHSQLNATSLNDPPETTEETTESTTTRNTTNAKILPKSKDKKLAKPTKTKPVKLDPFDDPSYTEVDDVVLESSGLLNINGIGEDRLESDTRAIDKLLVNHEAEPVNQYDNPSFWVNAFPVLFPFGCGGAEDKKRPVELTLTEWVRHMIMYYDGRFQTDASFLYACFAVLQTRERLTMTRVLYKKIFSNMATDDTNKITSRDLKTSLGKLGISKTLYNQGPETDKTLKILKNASIVGAKTRGSVYERGACRNELLALVTFMPLPNIFLTLNPADLENPFVCFWDGLNPNSKMEFNLNTLIGDFPCKKERAQLVGDNPVLPAKFFETVITAFLESFLGHEVNLDAPRTNLKKGKLLNETIFTGANSRGLKAFYGTVECQGRGSLHLHLLIWLSGIPSPEGTR